MRRYRGKHPTSIAAYREADTQTGAAERRPHNGWEAREAASVTGHRPRIPLASRDEEPPVTNALSSPDAVRRKHLTRRPLTTAYSDGPVAGPKTGERGTDENGNRTTLRCAWMFLQDRVFPRAFSQEGRTPRSNFRMLLRCSLS